MADLAQEAGLNGDESALGGASKLFVHLWSVAWSHSAGTIAGDAEALHDMRVAIRRLRSAMQCFEGPRAAPLLDSHLREEMASHRKKLGALGDVLGAVRDCDVLHEYLTEYAEKELRITVAEAPGLARFEQFLHQERERAFGPMVESIQRAQQPRRLREKFGRFALGFSAASAPPLSLCDAAEIVFPQRVEEVMANAPALDDDEDAEAQHELRKSLKRLRYSLEFFAPCRATAIKPHLKKLASLQDLLGEMNDRHVLHQSAHRAFAAPAKTGKRKQKEVKAAHEYSYNEDSLPADVALFLQFGDERATVLLNKVRLEWHKRQEQDWPSVLRLL